MFEPIVPYKNKELAKEKVKNALHYYIQTLSDSTYLEPGFINQFEAMEAVNCSRWYHNHLKKAFKEWREATGFSWVEFHRSFDPDGLLAFGEGSTI